MDLDFTFWLAIAAMYLLQFFLGKKKQNNAPAPLPELDMAEADAFGTDISSGSNDLRRSTGSHGSDDSRRSTELTGAPPVSGSSDFHDALSEISRMLGGSAPETPTPAPSPKPRTSLASIPNPKATSARKSLSKMPERKFYDEPFEQKGYQSFHQPDIQHPVLQVQQVKPSHPKKMTISQEVNRDIRDRAKAQEALVLAEVLGPPVSRRPRRTRW